MSSVARNRFSAAMVRRMARSVSGCLIFLRISTNPAQASGGIQAGISIFGRAAATERSEVSSGTEDEDEDEVEEEEGCDTGVTGGVTFSGFERDLSCLSRHFPRSISSLSMRLE